MVHLVSIPLTNRHKKGRASGTYAGIERADEIHSACVKYPTGHASAVGSLERTVTLLYILKF